MASYAERVGERLRNVRLQKGLSLHEVEERSGKEFKASVLGAYERGERKISVPRLHGLAAFYGVPTDHLLPRPACGDVDVGPPAGADEQPLRVDLRALGASEAPEAQLLARYLERVQMRRGDFNGRVLTIRRDDVRVLAAILDQSPGALVDRLGQLGLRQAGGDG